MRFSDLSTIDLVFAVYIDGLRVAFDVVPTYGYDRDTATAALFLPAFAVKTPCVSAIVDVFQRGQLIVTLTGGPARLLGINPISGDEEEYPGVHDGKIPAGMRVIDLSGSWSG